MTATHDQTVTHEHVSVRSRPRRGNVSLSANHRRTARTLSLAAWLAAGTGCAARPLGRDTLRAIRTDVAARSTETTTRSPDDSVRVELLRLATLDARDVARVLRELFDVDRHVAGAPIRAVVPDTRTNALVVFGTEQGIATARRLVAPLSGDPWNDTARAVDIVYLQHAQANDVFRIVRPLVHRDAQITVDTATNALVVADDRERLAGVRSLVARLDRARPE